jgi:hypothetical protein
MTGQGGGTMEVFVARCNVDRFIRMLAEATDPKEIDTLQMLLMNEQQILEEAIQRKWLIPGTLPRFARPSPHLRR